LDWCRCAVLSRDSDAEEQAPGEPDTGNPFVRFDEGGLRRNPAAQSSTLPAKAMGTSFGSIGAATLKLCGIATFTFGVASVIASMDRGKMSVTGIVMALHVMLLFYWALFAYLFSLEILETLMTVAIVMLIQSAAVCGIWKA
jgi:hypothetical protein